MQDLFFLIIIYVLLLIGLMILLKVNLFAGNRRISISENILRAKRDSITGPKLKRGVMLLIKLDSGLVRLDWTLKDFFILVAVMFLGGNILGFILFNDAVLSVIMGVVFTPLSYLFLNYRTMKASRREVDRLENTMSMITSAYLSTNDIVRAVDLYINEKNKHIPINQRIPTPFDGFVTEIMLVNPDIERALYILSAKYSNKYFNEWIRMLILCQRDRSLKFGLQPIIDAMTDAKIMQIENDSQMFVVWRDYFMTAALMFSVVPILRLSNVEWFNILTKTHGGKILMIIMLVAALLTSFYVMHINKPINTL